MRLAQAYVAELEAEIERLRNENEAWQVGQEALTDQLSARNREITRLTAEIERLTALLTRCETILENMALERPDAFLSRWHVHHEPLRADAKSLLPEVRAALEGEP